MTLHRKASILLLVAVATGAILPSYAATIIWDEAQNVSADADVSTEGDFVCDYSFHANWERMFVGWPHKVRKDSQLTRRAGR